MTNVVYRNLTKEEAEQMAFELEVEGRFEFEVKEEGGSWSVHYWSSDERPAVTDAPAAAGPAAPAGGTPRASPGSGLAEAPAPAPVAPAAPGIAAGPPAAGLPEPPIPAPVAPVARGIAAGPPAGGLPEPPAAVTGVAAGPPAATTTLFHPPAGWMLGSLSSKYETGGRGPGTVSSGTGDPGGVSYGSYQMTSRGGGTVLLFVSHDAFPWRERFAGLTPGSEAFSAAWRALAAEAPDAFFEAQHAYIERTHYAPVIRRIRSTTGLDVTSRSHALQDAAWSTAVQHGPNSSVMNRAIAAVGGGAALPLDDLDGDRRLIRAIYAERGRKGADGRLVYFPKVESDRVQQALADRFVNEERDALAMLES